MLSQKKIQKMTDIEQYKNYLVKDYLNSLNINVTKINISSRGLSKFPDLSRFKNLTELYCSDNHFTSLPALNNNLHTLYCCNNKLTILPSLSDNLINLNCSNNKLNSLPPLNDKLKFYLATTIN